MLLFKEVEPYVGIEASKGNFVDEKDLPGIETVEDALNHFNNIYWSILDNNMFNLIDPTNRKYMLAFSYPDESLIQYKDSYREYNMISDALGITSLYLNNVLSKDIHYINELYINGKSKDYKVLEMVYPKIKKFDGKMAQFGPIKPERYGFSISPLVQDILYAINKAQKLNINEFIYLAKRFESGYIVDGLTKEEEELFCHLYVSNSYSMIDVLKKVLDQNNINDGIIAQKDYDHIEPQDYSSNYTLRNYKYSIDPLNVLNALMDVKRSIIKKIIDLNLDDCNLNIPFIAIPEDNLDVVRVGVKIVHSRPTVYFKDAILDVKHDEYYETETYDQDDLGRIVTFARLKDKKR